MKLFLEANSERGKTITKSGNEFLEIIITDEERKNVCKLNVYYKIDTQEILTTFMPLSSQKISFVKNGKTIAEETETERYIKKV